MTAVIYLSNAQPRKHGIIVALQKLLLLTKLEIALRKPKI